MADENMTFLPDAPDDALESEVVVDADLPQHELQDAASAKANQLLDENEVLVNVELADSEAYGDGGVQRLQHFKYWKRTGP
jgi:hypothetical protein